MRYLNKIVFINSAHVPYEEVMLDGNVHFIGTQGVGKSTLLRALLFFYNANKKYLGIQPGQRTFDEFYFEYSNSYIIYEVMRETGAYSILVSRYQGRATFIFIDAPFKKEWLIEDNGNVLSDWVQIRNRIGKGIDVSKRIDTYETYRDIIFGNSHDSRHAFDKYAIGESKNYQNIPRSIQNVFLNSKLDAEFIKNTIIQSMVDEEKSVINLAAYRSQVADFEMEFKDISLWYKKERNGDVLIRQQADRIVESYRTIVALDHEILTSWHMLNYTLKHSEQIIPKLELNAQEIDAKRKAVTRKLGELSEIYNSEKDKLNYSLGFINGKLKDISQKRKHYEDINITAMLQLAAEEESISIKKSQFEEELRTLNAKNLDITQQYQKIFDDLETSRRDFEHQIETEIIKNNEQRNIELKKLADDKEKKLRSIDARYEEKQKESDSRWSNIYNDKSRLEGLLRDLNKWHPKEEEITGIKDEIVSKKHEVKELEAKLESVNREIERLRLEGKNKQSEIDHEYNDAITKEQRNESLLISEKKVVDDLLSHYNGSLYQWLENHKPGWQHTIGKVVDEQKVLYETGLNPELLSSVESLYGVKIDLTNITSTHRSPDEYKEEQKRLETEINEVKKRIVALETEKSDKLDTILKHYNKLINDWRQNATTLDTQIKSIPQLIKSLETVQYKLEHEEKKIVETEREVRQKRLDEVVLKLEKENKAREEMFAAKSREQKAADREYTKEYKNYTEKFNSVELALKSKIAENNVQCQEKKKYYEKERDNALKGKGVDVDNLKKIEKEIEYLQSLLQKIKQQSEEVYGYKKDTKELFSNEEEYKQKRKDEEARLNDLNKKFKDQKARLDDELQSYNIKYDSITNEKKALQDGVKEANEFIQSEVELPHTLRVDITEKSNNKSCHEIVLSIKTAIGKKRVAKENLKKSVNLFVNRFSTKNTFNFKTEFIHDYDYDDFALNIQEFLDNDKIEEYRRRSNEHYDDILRRISREVGYLMTNNSKVKDVINEVNRDFRERNFAGVIKSIELRSEDSSDRLMQLFVSIKKFTEEHLYTMGELNLFSGDDRDEVNEKVVEYLVRLMNQLQKEPSRHTLGLADTFRMQFRVKENDNDTGWQERISNVGSDGTDILVKAMVNIMLINVFKKRASRKFGDFYIHCMMDEIGKLHPNNIKGILQFANSRNIYLINSSPTTTNPMDYKYTYILRKNEKSQTNIALLLKKNKNEN